MALFRPKHEFENTMCWGDCRITRHRKEQRKNNIEQTDLVGVEKGAVGKWSGRKGGEGCGGGAEEM